MELYISSNVSAEALKYYELVLNIQCICDVICDVICDIDEISVCEKL